MNTARPTTTTKPTASANTMYSHPGRPPRSSMGSGGGVAVGGEDGVGDGDAVGAGDGSGEGVGVGCGV